MNSDFDVDYIRKYVLFICLGYFFRSDEGSIKCDSRTKSVDACTEPLVGITVYQWCLPLLCALRKSVFLLRLEHVFMIFELLKKRRSVFPAQYSNKPIAKADIEKILEAANWAPTHKKTAPWRFKVLQGASQEELGAFLSEKYQKVDPRPKQIKIKKLLENPVKAGAVIAICMQRDADECVPEWEEIAAVAMAVQNMWLSCTELSIGAYWSSPGLVKYMGEFFDLNEGEQCLGFFYMGYFNGELPDGERTPISDKVVWLD